MAAFQSSDDLAAARELVAELAVPERREPVAA
jgi:hypothetical protein